MRGIGGSRGAIGAALAAVLATFLAMPPAAASTGGITEYAIPTSSSLPQGITLGPDGALWFAERNANAIGRLTPDGTFGSFPVPTSSSQPLWIAVGPDGNLWFTERSANKIGRVTPVGTITEFAVPTAASQPTGIAAGPDGAMWFTEQGASRIGRIAMTGRITEFLTPTAKSGPYGITLGPDGAMWFTEQGVNKVARVTMTGRIAEVPVVPGGLLSGIATGPDGNVWFTERTGQSIVSITPDMATISVYPLPTGGGPVGIAAGPDGRLWFTENSADRIGAISIAGVFAEFPLPTTGSQPFGIASGPGGMWFTEQAGNRIGFLPVVTDTTPPTVSIVTPSASESYLLGSSVAADYSCADEGGSGLASCAGPVPSGSAIDTSTAGTYDFTVTATDGAGNQTSGTKTYTVFADTTPPTIDLVSPADGDRYLLGSSVAADYSCADGGGSGLWSCAGPVPSGSAIDTSTAGTYDFTVTAEDGAGNETSVTHGYTVFADTTPPTVDLVSPADGDRYLLGSSVAADYSCADEGGSGLATCRGTVPSGSAIDTSTAGTYDFTVTATDGAGNQTSVTHGYTVFADTTPPTIDLVSPADGDRYLLGSKVTADYSCADEGGSGLATCHGTVPSGSAIDTSAAGTYDFTVKATDGAGNRTSVTHSYKVFADTTAPAVDLETPPDLAWYLVGQTAYAKYSCADDGGSGLATCRGTVPSGSPIDTTLGPHSFTVTATDGAGNRTSVTHSYVVLAGVSGTILDASPKAGSALTLMIDLGQSAGALTPNGTVRGTVPRASTKHKTGPRAQTSMPTTQAASCGDPSVMLGSSQVADVRAMGYDGTGRLSLTWKTDRSWAGTCRALLVPIDAWGGATAAFVVRFA